MRDHLGFDADDYDAPSLGDQQDFFAVRDDYDRGHHTEGPIQSTPDVWTAKPAA